MNLDQATNAILQRWKDESAIPTTRWTVPNVSFQPPEETTWARITVVELDSRQVSMGDIGNRRFDNDGMILVNCFAPLGKGAQAALVLAQVAKTVFGSVAFSDLHTFAATHRILGKDPDGWWVVVVEIRFRYYEIK